MDIKAYDIGAAADVAQPMEVKHPGSGLPILDESRKPLIIFLKGNDSPTFRKKDRELTANRLNAARRRNDMVAEASDFETSDRDDAALLAAVTTGFSDNFEFEGKPAVAEIAERLYREQPWISEQVKAFIKKRSNFLKS